MGFFREFADIKIALKEEDILTIWQHVDALYPTIKLENVPEDKQKDIITFLLSLLYLDEEKKKEKDQNN